MRTVILFTVMAASAAACSSKAAEPDAAVAVTMPVDVGRVTMAGAPDRFEAGGVVRARTSAAITSRILAPVLEMRVAPGDRVRAGQVLVVLDARDLSAAARGARASARAAVQGSAASGANARAAEAALALARATHGRIAALHARQSATSQELDEASAALAAADARAAAARADVARAAAAVDSAEGGSDAATVTASFARITAPFDGLVTETLIDPGSMAAPGAPLLRLEDARAFRLEVHVDESRIQQIAPGAAVAVTIDSGSSATAAAVTGRVDEIGRAVDADARAFLVKIALPFTVALRSGMFGRAAFEGAPRQALRLPAGALVRQGQLTSVFVVEGGHARLRLVSVRGDEVLAGVTDGEWVVVSPPAGLADGRAVAQRTRR